MKAKNLGWKMLSVLVLGALSWASSAQADDVRMQGAGSTFVAPIMQRWVSEYQKLHPTIKIDYESIGSGGGVKYIMEKTVSFGASDAPMNKKELASAGAPMVQIPVIAGAVVVEYNLPGVNDLRLDGPTLADIYLGNITKWNDAKLLALNPGVAMPDLGITTAHRTDGSGTTYIFTNYLCTQSTGFSDKIGAGKSVEWIGGQGGKGSEGVTQVVESIKGALGYSELAYAVENKLSSALIKNQSGEFVKGSPAAAAAAAGDAVAKNMTKTLVAALWDQPGKDVYPISGFSYVMVYQDLGYFKDQAKAQALVDFLHWATHDGQKMAAELQYAPLNDAVKEKVGQALDNLSYDGKPLRSGDAK